MIESQLNYRPVVWMFSSRQPSNLTNKIHERSIRLKNCYQNLLYIHKKFLIHQKNLQALMTKIYKTINGLAPPLMNSLFVLRNNEYDIRSFEVLPNDTRKKKLNMDLKQSLIGHQPLVKTAI